jgi:hypothetical protein
VSVTLSRHATIEPTSASEPTAQSPSSWISLATFAVTEPDGCCSLLLNGKGNVVGDGNIWANFFSHVTFTRGPAEPASWS